MKYNFTLRLYKNTHGNTILSYLQNITISDITLISKPSKFGEICMHRSNQKKFKYNISLSSSFLRIAGSHSSPCLAFKGEYIDIIVKNFPRYPVLTQNHYLAINSMNIEWAGRFNEFGNWEINNSISNGFPHQLMYRKLDVLFDSGQTLPFGLY